MANYVKFIKGTAALYTLKASTYAADGSIFFVTDKNSIYTGGVEYGINSDTLAALQAAIDEKFYSVSGPVINGSGATLTFTSRALDGSENEIAQTVTFPLVSNTVGSETSGLMTAAQKTALETAISDLAALAEDVEENKINQVSGKSTNKTILVTPGTTTESNGTKTTTNTNIEVNLGDTLILDADSGEIDVNIDGSTIIKDASTGVLSVASTALTQYVGDNLTVEVSAANNNNNKTVSSPLKIHQMTAQEIAASSLDNKANIAEAYKIVGKNGADITGSDVIKVYKDSALVDFFIGHVDDSLTDEDSTSHESTTTTVTSGTGNDALVYIYSLANGNYKLQAIDIENFMTQAEYGQGLEVVDNSDVSPSGGNDTTGKRFQVKVDSTSGQVITAYSTANGNTNSDVISVSANGVKVDNIQAAITAAIGKAQSTLNTTVSGESASHMTITETTADNGAKSYAFALTDIASEDALEAEVTRAEDIESKMAEKAGLVITKTAGQPTTVTYTPDSNLNYKTIADANAQGGSRDVATLPENIKALDTQVKANADAISNLNSNFIDDITVNGVAATVSNNDATVEIDASNIKLSKAAADASTALVTGGNIVKGDTIQAAVASLEAQLLWYEA